MNKSIKKPVKIILIILAVAIVIIGIAVGIFFLLISPRVDLFGIPLDEARLTAYSDTVSILDCDGNPIEDNLFYGNCISVDIDELNSYTANAFIAIEDKRFYSHGGIDYKRIASALLSNVKSRSFREGASTITQQLIKNTHLSNEKTIKRKLVEMRLARELETKFDKDDILESYLNILYFGSGIRGLGTASRVMFDKPASELSLAQSAALASIINNPSKYSPYNNFDNLVKRKNLVLKEMLNQGFISENEYVSARDEALSFSKNQQNQFIEGLIKNTCEKLNCTEKQLFMGNYVLQTDYSPAISESVRKAIQNTELNGYIRVVVLKNASGGISCDETNCKKYLNPHRSPASSIKPFISYAPALERGYNPLSQIEDEKTDFNGYSPRNYKNVYRGYQSLTDCLIHSSNIAAVKLLDECGVDHCKSIANSFGIKFEKADEDLTLALGSMEKGITLPELANAYRTLANGGLYGNIGYVCSVSQDNTIAFKSENCFEPAVGDDTAYLLTDMLTQCAKKGTAKKLAGSGILAAKTGTNGDKNGNYDCYCVAYTPEYTVAVWFGAKENALDNKITGASCCDIIKSVIADGSIPTNKEFVRPRSVAYYDVDGLELSENHKVYLADPLLPKRYHVRALLSKRHLPIRKPMDMIDYFDGLNEFWESYGLQLDELDIPDSLVD